LISLGGTLRDEIQAEGGVGRARRREKKSNGGGTAKAKGVSSKAVKGKRGRAYGKG